MVSDRLQPHDIGAEESVVGSILIDGEALTRVTTFLKPGDFYSQRNRKCYEACVALFDRNGAINQVTVAHELSLEDGTLESVGGAAYLASLVSRVPTSVHIEHYARIVHTASVMRQIIRVGAQIVDMGYDGGTDEDAVISRAEELIYRIRSGRGSRDFTHIRYFMDSYMEHTGALEDPSAIALAPVITGFPKFDELLGGGLQRSDLVILAARPSLGKSTLALNMARHAAGEGFYAGVFSLEMSGEQIAVRLIASEANIGRPPPADEPAARPRRAARSGRHRATVRPAHLHRRNAVPVHDGRPQQGAPPSAGTRARPAHHRLSADNGHGRRRQPRGGAGRSDALAEGARARARHPRNGVFAAKPRGRAAPNPPPAAVPTCAKAAPSSRTPTSSPSYTARTSTPPAKSGSASSRPDQNTPKTSQKSSSPNTETAPSAPSSCCSKTIW